MEFSHEGSFRFEVSLEELSDEELLSSSSKFYKTVKCVGINDNI